jgi:hypothetical protein
VQRAYLSGLFVALTVLAVLFLGARHPMETRYGEAPVVTMAQEPPAPAQRAFDAPIDGGVVTQMADRQNGAAVMVSTTLPSDIAEARLRSSSKTRSSESPVAGWMLILVGVLLIGNIFQRRVRSMRD